MGNEKIKRCKCGQKPTVVSGESFVNGAFSCEIRCRCGRAFSGTEDRGEEVVRKHVIYGWNKLIKV